MLVHDPIKPNHGSLKRLSCEFNRDGSMIADTPNAHVEIDSVGHVTSVQATGPKPGENIARTAGACLDIRKMNFGGL
jgi:hypothetical protein